MKLLILGATGLTGRQLVRQALDAGHSVAALVRDPRKVTDSIEVLQGDATNSSAVAGAVRGRDAVLSALGTSKSFKGGVSAFGVGESFQKFFFRTVLRSIYADKEKADAMIQASALQWTIVRPVAPTNGPRTGNYRVGEHLQLRGFPKVSRADVADFMIRVLTEQTWVRKTVVIA